MGTGASVWQKPSFIALVLYVQDSEMGFLLYPTHTSRSSSLAVLESETEACCVHIVIGPEWKKPSFGVHLGRSCQLSGSTLPGTHRVIPYHHHHPLEDLHLQMLGMEAGSRQVLYHSATAPCYPFVPTIVTKH